MKRWEPPGTKPLGTEDGLRTSRRYALTENRPPIDLERVQRELGRTPFPASVVGIEVTAGRIEWRYE